MKTALIQPPSWGIKNPPFASAVLSAWLRRHGHDVYKRDLNIELYRLCQDGPFGEKWKLNESFWGMPDQVEKLFTYHKPTIDEIVAGIVASGARLVGFSTVWSSVQPALILAREIKRVDRDIVTVFGGPQCSVNAEGPNVLAAPWVDYAISGEGEATLLELVEAIERNGATDGIRGLIYRSGGRIAYGGDRPLIADLNTLPCPDFDGYDLSLYEKPVMLPLTTSRGCPNRCIYCDEKTLWKTFRYRNGRRIYDEVVELVSRYGIDRFEFCDSLVNGSIKALEEFCDLVIANGLKISWMGQATVRAGMTRNLLEKIVRSGCFHLCFGMEHYSKKLLQGMGKVICRDTDFDRLIRDCHDVGLGTGLNWMFGFLGETEDDFQEDLDFFTRNAPSMNMVSVNPSPGFCGFTKGCMVYEDPEKYGVILHEDSRYWESADGANTFPVRLDKYQRFCRHLRSLGISITFEPFEEEKRLKGEYYFSVKQDYELASSHFENSLLNEGFSEEKFSLYIESCRRSDSLWKALRLYRALADAGLDGKERYGAEKLLRDAFPFLTTRQIRECATSFDLALVQAPAWGVYTPPMATAALTAYMRGEGYRVLAQDLNITMFQLRGEEFASSWNLAESLVFWNNREDILLFAEKHRAFLERWVDYVLGCGVDAIGFTIYNSSYYMSLYLADVIKRKNSSVKVIFGGPFVSRFMVGDEAAAQVQVDVVVDGEGEYTLKDLMERIQGSGNLLGCPGTIQRSGDETVLFDGRELIRDLDSLPFPDYSDYALQLYEKRYTLPSMSSRGCPNACIFCNERPFWKTYRSRSGRSIFNEMVHMLKLYPHIRFFEFHDSLINGNIRELENLCDLIIASGLKAQWAGQAAIRKEMTYELLVKLGRAGCVSLGYGVETASSSLMEKVGKLLARGADPYRILADGHRAGVQCSINFMFGLPGETDEDFRENLNFIRKNRDYIGTVNPSPAFCGFSPGTKAYEEPERFGIVLEPEKQNYHLFWKSKDGTNNYEARLGKFEAFCDLVADLGIDTTYPHRKLLNRDEMLRDYFLYKGEKAKALPHVFRLMERDGQTELTGTAFLECWENAPMPLKSVFPSPPSCDTDLIGTFRSTVENEAGKRIDSRDFNGAALLLEQALTIDVTNVDCHLMLTDIYLNKRCFGEAERTLVKLIEVCPDYREGMEYLATVRRVAENGAIGAASDRQARAQAL